MKLRHFFLNGAVLFAFTALAACDQGDNPLDSVNLTLAGSATYTSTTNFYIFGNSAGAVDAGGNTIILSFYDSATPLMLNSFSGVFTPALQTGTCSSISNMVAAVNNNEVFSSFSATGCTDNTTINCQIDTSQVFDQDGFSGWNTVPFTFTIDLAPKVSVVATGNTAADGTGTTEGSAGVYKITGGVDSSIVVTFSKSMTGGTLTASLSAGCGVLGSPVLVSPVNGTTVAWPVDTTGITPPVTCSLNVSTMKDAVTNPEDPADPNVSMSINFQ